MLLFLINLFTVALFWCFIILFILYQILLNLRLLMQSNSLSFPPTYLYLYSRNGCCVSRTTTDDLTDQLTDYCYCCCCCCCYCYGCATAPAWETTTLTLRAKTIKCLARNEGQVLLYLCAKPTFARVYIHLYTCSINIYIIYIYMHICN